MTSVCPPTIDPRAARRWQQCAPAASPWLHEEVARRMQERLQWICRPPASWCHWDAVRGGLQAHALVAQQFPQADCYVIETQATNQPIAQNALDSGAWWNPRHWTKKNIRWAMPADTGVDMLWANMALHMSPEPLALMRQWHQALAVNGYVMFSALGPDTAQELHHIYAKAGWPPAGHAMTDMHDWGDMLLQAGFSEPIMDMERIVLTFSSPQRLLAELAELGCNLNPSRFAGLRTPRWQDQLYQALMALGQQGSEQGQIPLTFEIIYGHAYKIKPTVSVQSESIVGLDDMRAMLKRHKTGGNT